MGRTLLTGISNKTRKNLPLRDGTNFRYVLNYMRDGEVKIPDDQFLVDELIKDAGFYMLPEMVNQLKKMVKKI